MALEIKDAGELRFVKTSATIDTHIRNTDVFHRGFERDKELKWWYSIRSQNTTAEMALAGNSCRCADILHLHKFGRRDDIHA